MHAVAENVQRVCRGVGVNLKTQDSQIRCRNSRHPDVLDQNLHGIGDSPWSQERLEAQAFLGSLRVEEPLGFLLPKAFLQASIQEKLPLSPQGFALPAQLRTRLLHHLKVDVGGDVRATQVDVRVWNHLMAVIAKESSVSPVPGIILSPVVPIIHGQNHSGVDAPVKLLCASGRGYAQDHQQQKDFQPNDSSCHSFLFIDVASPSEAA